MHASALGSGVVNYRGGPGRNLREVKDPFLTEDDWGLNGGDTSLNLSISHPTSVRVRWIMWKGIWISCFRHSKNVVGKSHSSSQNF